MIAFIFLLTGVSAAQCHKYSCTLQISTDKCLAYDSGSDTYKISYCNLDYICPTTDPTKQEASCTVIEPEPSNNYPGEICTSNSDCTSNSCLRNVCQGITQSQTCAHVYDCNPGLYCDPVQLVCLAQVAIGKSCVIEQQCVNSALCVSSTCQPYFSQAIGYTFTNMPVDLNNGFNMVCASGYATLKNGIYVCAKASTSTGTNMPLACETGTQCTSSDGVYSVFCACGYNPTGTAYCPLFVGDAITQGLLVNWNSLIPYNLNCNTNNRWSYQCYATQSAEAQIAFNYFMIGYMQFNEGQWPLIQGNSLCIQESYTKDFHNLQNAVTRYTNPTCPVYYCTPADSNWGQNQCIVYKQEFGQFYLQETLYMNTCKSGEMCPPTRTTNSTCQTTPVTMGYPGDHCTENNQCTTGSCKSKKCTGLAKGVTCTYIYDCNPGLFCNTTSSVCQSQVAAKQACSSDFDCQNSLTCSLGACVPYFSVPAGAKTDVIDYNGMSMACITGFATLLNTIPLTGTCATAPISVPNKELCVLNSVCQDTTEMYTKPCTCGYNPAGFSYCPSFEGDKYLQSAISAMRLLNSYNVDCNTFSRRSEGCYLRYPKYLKQFYYYATNFTMYQQYPLLQMNPECAENIYTGQYYGLLDRLQKGDFSSSGKILSFMMGLALLLVN